MRAASGCLHLQFRIILHYVPDFQPRTMILLPGTRNILPTKTDDAGAAAQPKRRGRGAVRRANGLSADSTLDFRCRFARHRASPASFRPSGRHRAVGHETLRVTKGHENARPSVVSDNRRCQAAQAASGNANSSWSGSFSGGLRGRSICQRFLYACAARIARRSISDSSSSAESGQLLRTAYYSGTNERTPFRSHVLPHMTLVASCGVFVIFRGAERFVFRARTDPKDAMPRRRCGEGRANITSSEAELNGRLRPSNRGRRHGVAAAEPPVRTRIFVFQPGGLGWTG